MKKLVIPIVFLVIALSFSSSCNKNENGDKNAPYIVVNPPNPQYWALDNPYQDAGAEAFDITQAGDTINITDRLQTTDNVNVAVTGEYEVLYNVTDAAGNAAEPKTRVVKVVLTK
jgi:hypothetical protein